MQEITPELVMQKVSAGKQYILLHLLSGKPADPDETRMNQLQMQHLTHLFGLEQEGRAFIFGPVINHESLKGIVVFNSNSKEEVHGWMQNDPFVREGYLHYELFDFFTIPGQAIAG